MKVTCNAASTNVVSGWRQLLGEYAYFEIISIVLQVLDVAIAAFAIFCVNPHHSNLRGVFEMKDFNALNDAVGAVFGNARRIVGKRPVSGGDINEAYLLTLDDGSRLFMKANVPSFLDNYHAEAGGLKAIRNTGAIRVPSVLATGTDPEGFSFLLLEHIENAGKQADYWERFGRNLANMHRAAAPSKSLSQSGDRLPSKSLSQSGDRLPSKGLSPSEGLLPSKDLFGFDSDNYIGSSAQINEWHDSWVSFFRECRLGPQFQWADRYFDDSDRKKIRRLLDNLEKYLPEPDRPSLLHGDLWSGNYITGNDGHAWLIDPAVYCGHPEADIAMTELFGGFSPRFYDAYRESGLLESGYEDRRDLYNLYHLLNHLNLFGSAYLQSVKRILSRYAGF